MSEDRTATSPTRFSGDIDSMHNIYDPNFTEEINQKMQVPKRIKVNGENEDDVIVGIGGNHPSHAWENEKFEMHVPDRILVVGQEQCVGIKKAPVEVVNHEHVVMPPDPGFVRVQTPPRVITLADHYFPTADDMPTPIAEEPSPAPVIIRANKPRNIIDADGDHKNEIHPLHREGTPSLTEGLTTNDEIAHLRRQLAKLNRRVMSLELEILQRQQYEKIVYVCGIAIVLWKALCWLRNS